MYDITLTLGERQAFDWVGDRYNAWDVKRILIDCLEENDSWCDECDITFLIPEYRAWAIKELAEGEDYLWPCFSPELKEKLNNLCLNIV